MYVCRGIQIMKMCSIGDVTCVSQEQDAKLSERYQQMLQQRLDEQSEQFQSSVAGNISRLRGIESAIEGVTATSAHEIFPYILVKSLVYRTEL